VLHCPVNTAGIPWENSQALRRRGIESNLLVFNRYKLHPEADISLDRRGNLVQQQLTQWRAFLKLLPRYDVFHFYSSVTLVPKSVQFRILHALGKRGVHQYLGSDIRGKTREQLAYGLAADAEIVSSYDAIRWVPHADVVLPGIEVARIEPAVPSAEAKRPVIVHAPSSRRRKGTEHVVAAVEGLDADLRIVEGLTHDEAFELYRQADIVVDQLNAGWYGVFAIECLALGKPVVTFLHDEAVRRTEEAYGVEVPLVSATAETLRERLRPLVEDAALRHRIGAASRAYAEKLHDIDAIAGELVGIYERIMESTRTPRRDVDAQRRSDADRASRSS
jgi:glycosyltransferase involved in cell wall biosynthesis